MTLVISLITSEKYNKLIDILFCYLIVDLFINPKIKTRFNTYLK